MNAINPVSVEDRLRARITTLEKQLDEAQDRIVEIEATFGLTDTDELWQCRGFTKQEGRMLQCLLSMEFATRDQLMFALYRDSPERYERYDKVADVYICKLRKKLTPLGIDIQTIWGTGRKLSGESKAKLRSVFQ